MVWLKKKYGALLCLYLVPERRSLSIGKGTSSASTPPRFKASHSGCRAAGCMYVTTLKPRHGRSHQRHFDCETHQQ